MSGRETVPVPPDIEEVPVSSVFPGGRRTVLVQDGRAIEAVLLLRVTGSIDKQRCACELNKRYFFQNSGTNSTRAVTTSSRPIHMQKKSSIFPAG